MVRLLGYLVHRMGTELAERFAAIGGEFSARIYHSMWIESFLNNSSNSARFFRKHPSEAKASLLLQALLARLKSCPDTKLPLQVPERVFPHPVDSCPDTSRPLAEFFRSLPASPAPGCGPGGPHDNRPGGRRYLFADALLILAAAALCAAPAGAQYVGQAAKSDNAPELRSVAVLEWIGDDQLHPSRSRIIPITVFDGHDLQDGGIYLARPQPLALDHEVEYQLKQDGKSTGLFIVYGAADDNGSWVGYGKLQPMPKPKPPKPLNAHDFSVDDTPSDQPVLHRKHSAGDAGSSSDSAGSGNPAEAPDPDRPTLHKGPGADSGSGSDTASNSGSNSSSGPAADPDRPTLHKGPDSGDSSAAGAGSDANDTSDPDRPKLTKKKTSGSGDDDGSVSSVDTTDPNRPKLQRGQVSYGGGDLSASTPTLKGLPPEMHQAVAVSDARNTHDHPWDYSWANPDDEQKYKTQLEDLARTALGLTPPPAPAPAKKTAAKTATHKSAKAAPAPPAEPAPLEDEQYRVFELAYSSGATMVLSAHTAGTGAQEKFVTLVAQPDLYGNLTVLMKNTTDGAHLDVMPQMHLIDAVDAMADNRGELLFELRGTAGRQFALYRVLRGQVTKLFVSGGSDMNASN